MRFLLPALFALGAIWPTAALAAGDPSVDEVRATYVDAGMVVSNPAFSADGVATFMVTSAGQPTLRVHVFSSTAAAAAEHQQAHARAEAMFNRSIADSNDTGPQLLSGYSLSLWRQNVALVQAAPADDEGASMVEADCGSDTSPVVTPLPRTTVAPIFVAPLEALIARSLL